MGKAKALVFLLVALPLAYIAVGYVSAASVELRYDEATDNLVVHNKGVVPVYVGEVRIELYFNDEKVGSVTASVDRVLGPGESVVVTEDMLESVEIGFGGTLGALLYSILGGTAYMTIEASIEASPYVPGVQLPPMVSEYSETVPLD